MFLTCFVDFCGFGPFLASWRPGNASKGILKVIGFDSTEYEPVGRHGDPIRIHFHDFPDHPNSAEYGLLTAEYGLLTAVYRLLTVDYKLLTVDYGVMIADYRLMIAY